jgi:hypothetical protein
MAFLEFESPSTAKVLIEYERIHGIVMAKDSNLDLGTEDYRRVWKAAINAEFESYPDSLVNGPGGCCIIMTTNWTGLGLKAGKSVLYRALLQKRRSLLTHAQSGVRTPFQYRPREGKYRHAPD